MEKQQLRLTALLNLCRIRQLLPSIALVCCLPTHWSPVSENAFTKASQLSPAMLFHSTTDLMRKIHMTSTHWLQILVGVHLGLHWKPIANLFANGYRLDLEHWLARRLIPACWLIIAAYGIFVFVQRELLPYLLLQVDFAYFNYDESQAVFYFDFLAILIALAYSTRFLVWFFLFRKKDVKS